MNPLIDTIYNEVFAFCEDAGLIEKLKESFKIPEAERYAELNISQGGLDILDAVHCVYDKSRSYIFLHEIDKIIKGGEIVIEAGIGTGLLSFFAAAKDARVYGIELNPAILELANNIKQHLADKKLINPENVQFIIGDATKYIPPEKSDLIISENIYTGMFHEKQVQIMNHLVQFLKEGGKVIPCSLQSFLLLNYSPFPHQPKHLEEFVPSDEEGLIIPAKPLSTEIEYSDLDFHFKNEVSINKTVTIPITIDGELNSVLVYSLVPMESGHVIGRFDTTFLNGDMVIAIQPVISVKTGDKIQVHIAYEYGMQPDNITLEIKKIS